jgi:RNA polymerase sigma-70 factor (ECF subfamily)
MTAPLLAEPAERTDEHWMAQLVAGEDSALAPLMQRWELPLKGFLLRFGLNATDAEDLAQETFVRVYQQRARFEAGLHFKPWVLTIAGNLARNRLRWRARHPLAEPESGKLAPGVADEAPDPTTAALREEERHAVREALLELPLELRQAVLAVDIEELTYREAAGALGCSPKAIEHRLAKARALLRIALHRFIGV